jgi:hypothetical protein
MNWRRLIRHRPDSDFYVGRRLKRVAPPWRHAKVSSAVSFGPALFPGDAIQIAIAIDRDPCFVRFHRDRFILQRLRELKRVGVVCSRRSYNAISIWPIVVTRQIEQNLSLTRDRDSRQPGNLAALIHRTEIAMTPRSSRARASLTAQPQSTDSQSQREAASEPKADPVEPAQWQDDPAITVNDRQRVIRESAYRRFEARGCVHGRDLEDWLEAEAELETKRNDTR